MEEMAVPNGRPCQVIGQPHLCTECHSKWETHCPGEKGLRNIYFKLWNKSIKPTFWNSNPSLSSKSCQKKEKNKMWIDNK